MKISPNTLELAADLQFWLTAELNADTGEARESYRTKIRVARADLSAAVLGDLRSEIAVVLKRREAAGR